MIHKRARDLVVSVETQRTKHPSPIAERRGVASSGLGRALPGFRPTAGLNGVPPNSVARRAPVAAWSDDYFGAPGPTLLWGWLSAAALHGSSAQSRPSHEGTPRRR